jgi:hypothetical protein
MLWGLDSRDHGTDIDHRRSLALLGSMCFAGMVPVVWLGPCQDCVCAAVRWFDRWFHHRVTLVMLRSLSVES